MKTQSFDEFWDDTLKFEFHTVETSEWAKKQMKSYLLNILTEALPPDDKLPTVDDYDIGFKRGWNIYRERTLLAIKKQLGYEKE